MKTAAFALALMLSGAALAQAPAYDGDGLASAAWEQDNGGTAMPADVQPGVTLATAVNATDAVVQPSNASPERDARGIPVISASAVVPAGWNGVAGGGEAMGGPLLDPATGEPMADTANYPACTRTITDHCLQTYERRRAR
ncbi:MAG: hypothetical protein QOJ94_183 [Sphingomonadales bacterium]|jgi:hypothetical protein|nr:hypothetical protein [Sphingomonadales bacterium]